MSTQRTLTWSPARQRIAAAAILAAGITALTLVGRMPSGTNLYLGTAYIAITVLALFSAAWGPAQVIAGQLIAAILLLSPQGPGSVVSALALVTVIVTAELLAAAARPDAAFQRHWPGDLRRAASSAAIGAIVFAVVLFVRNAPAPAGILSIAIGSAACLLMAALLAARTPST